MFQIIGYSQVKAIEWREGHFIEQKNQAFHDPDQISSHFRLYILSLFSVILVLLLTDVFIIQAWPIRIQFKETKDEIFFYWPQKSKLHLVKAAWWYSMHQRDLETRKSLVPLWKSSGELWSNWYLSSTYLRSTARLFHLFDINSNKVSLVMNWKVLLEKQPCLAYFDRQ